MKQNYKSNTQKSKTDSICVFSANTT